MENFRKKIEKKKFSLNFMYNNYEFDFPSLYGDHQIENASTDITTVLATNNFNISKDSINSSLLKTNWPARMQNLNGKLSKFSGSTFDIWLDGGHNIDASKIISSIIENWKERNIILIIGMINGKDPVNFSKKFIHNISLLINITNKRASIYNAI